MILMSNVSLIWTDFKYQLFLDNIMEFGCSEDDWEWLRLSSRLLLLWFSSKVSNKQNCRCKWSKKVYRWIWWNKFAHYTLLRWFSVWWSLQTTGNEMLLSQNVNLCAHCICVPSSHVSTEKQLCFSLNTTLTGNSSIIQESMFPCHLCRA